MKDFLADLKEQNKTLGELLGIKHIAVTYIPVEHELYQGEFACLHVGAEVVEETRNYMGADGEPKQEESVTDKCLYCGKLFDYGSEEWIEDEFDN